MAVVDDNGATSAASHNTQRGSACLQTQQHDPPGALVDLGRLKCGAVGLPDLAHFHHRRNLGIKKCLVGLQCIYDSNPRDYTRGGSEDP